MIIGISGKIKSGKDTLGKALAELIPNAQIKKYATKLKLIAGLLLGVDPDRFEDRAFKESQLGVEWNYWSVDEDRYSTELEASYYGKLCGFTPVENTMTVRDFLIDIGTNAIRKGLHPDTWINGLLSDYNPEEVWIVTDVRMYNEAEAIRKLGGKILRIDRPGIETKDHITETELDNYEFDERILNNTETVLSEFAKEYVNRKT